LVPAGTAYLAAAAARHTGGNVSAVVDLIVRSHALREAIEQEALCPLFAETAEAERQGAGAA